MAICEFSGEECGSTVKIELAGAVLNVSEKYAHLGKRIEEKKPTLSSTKYIKKKEKTQICVVVNASNIIQQLMSKRNLLVKHIAHHSNVKEGSLQKMISNKIPFDVKVAQSIEKAFDITLTQEVSIDSNSTDTNIDEYISQEDESTSNMEELMKDILNKIR